MGNFLKMVLFGLGMLALTVVVAVVVSLYLLAQRGENPAKLLREFVLQPEEKMHYASGDHRPATPAEVQDLAAIQYDRELSSLADAIGEATLRELIADLTRRQRLMDERERNLNRRSENLDLAEADFHRLRRHIQDEREAIDKQVMMLADFARPLGRSASRGGSYRSGFA